MLRPLAPAASEVVLLEMVTLVAGALPYEQQHQIPVTRRSIASLRTFE